MANVCDNTLKVYGLQTSRFVLAAQGPNGLLDFGKFLPMPVAYDDLNVTQEMLIDWYGYETAHDWRLGEWGTKSNAQEVTLDIDPHDQYLTYFFVTPWTGPNENLIEAMSHMYPSLKLYLSSREPDLGYYKALKAHGGRIV